ncbi:MAG: iron-sulfur cluster assembly scaffold protein [Desulfotomaculales bacterium]
MDAKLRQLAADIEKQMWADYTEQVVDHALNPRNVGRIEDADGFARVTGGCGDSIEIWIRVTNDAITEITFRTDGCGASIAAGSMVTELAKGKTVREALRISGLDVLNALGGLPAESEHCAVLAANALNAAITQYFKGKK